MTFFSKMSDAAALVSGMATRLDVDLAGQAQVDPSQTARSYAEMVKRCAACSEHEACRRLQDQMLALEVAPNYCRNRDVLRRAGSPRM